MKINRTYSKWLVALNASLAWGLMYYSIPFQQAMYVIPVGFTFILGICAYYMNIGHKDLQVTTKAIRPVSTNDSVTLSPDATPIPDSEPTPLNTGATTNVSISTQ